MSSRDPIPNLRQRLLRARIELALAGVERGLVGALWQWLALVVLVVITDVVWPISEPFRAVVAVLLLVGAVRVLLRCIPARAVRRASAEGLAREVEERCNLLHNPLIAAVQLQAASAATGPEDVSALLRGRLADRGEAAARASAESRLVNRAARRTSHLALGAAIAFIAVAAAMAPRQIDAVAMRLIDPFGDHPPYTPLTFAVTIEPAGGELVYGETAEVRVQIAGGNVPHADLVLRTPGRESTPIARIAMEREARSGTDPHSQLFRAVAPDVREAIELMIETPGGRSKWIEIVPRLEPRWAARTLRIRGPEYGPIDDERSLPLSDDPEPVRLLQGSRLRVEAVSTLPLRALVASGSGAADGAVGPDRLTGEWTWFARDAGARQINLMLVGETGVQSTPTRLRVEVVADAPPEVRINQPPSSAAALPEQKFTALFEAVDDVEVDDISCVVEVVRDGEVTQRQEQLLRREQQSPQRLVAALDVDLAEFALEPDDVVRLVASARDQRPESAGGAQMSEVAASEILVIDEQVYATLAGGAVGSADSEDRSEEKEEIEATSAGAGDLARNGSGEQSDRRESQSGSGAVSAEPGVELAGGGDSGEEVDGGSQGQTPSESARELASRDVGPPEDLGGSPGGAGSASVAASAPHDLLEQARRRSLIRRDGTPEPNSGRTDPNAPRESHPALSEFAAPPDRAASRITTRIEERGAEEANAPMAGIPVRYRDLAARYFERLAGLERDNAPEEDARDD